MKIAFALSLILNAILGFLYIQEKSRPPLERIVVEEKTVVKKVSVPAPTAPGTLPKPKKTVEEGDEFQPIVPGDEQGMEMAVNDLELAKKDFFHKLDIPENTLREKEKIMQDFFKKTMPIYQKHPTAITMSFKERRELIDLEEEAQSKVRSLFGEKKWNEYKKFVDQYNKKVIQGTKTGEYTGVLMGY